MKSKDAKDNNCQAVITKTDGMSNEMALIENETQSEAWKWMRPIQ